MYAIFEDGGKQYKVKQGDVLLIERRESAEPGGEIVFDKVLMVGQGEESTIGTPWVEGASVTARVTHEIKTPKVTTIKFKRRKGYVLKQGHRQKMLRVEIGAING